MGSRFHQEWHDSVFHSLTAHFPGILMGGFSALFFWVLLSMHAAWQNCLLFPEAMRRIGYIILPLSVCFYLSWKEYHGEDRIPQWIAILPFAISFFLAAGVVRRIQAQALPEERKNPLKNDIDYRIPLSLLVLISLERFWDWYAISSMRHNHFYSNAYDLGLMTHVLNRFVTGEGLTSSLLVSGGSFLGHHFSPILYLIAPFSFFCPHAETLLAFQAALVAFATVPLYLFARVYLRSGWVAFAVAVIYLFLPGLSKGVYADFHAICFAPFLLFWLAAEAVRGTGKGFWAALVLLLCIQENLFLYSFFLGLFFLVHQKHRRVGLWISGISLLGGILIFLVFQPMFRPETDLGYGFVHRYRDFLPEAGPAEAGVGDLMMGVLTQPGQVFSLAFDETRMGIYKLFWRGVFYFPLINPAGWLLLAPVLENSLSSEAHLNQWTGHYGIGPASLTALALVAGLGLLGRFSQFRERYLPIGLTLLVSSIFWGLKKAHLPYSIYLMSLYYANPSEPPDVYRALLEEIPPGSSVSAQSHLVPHLVHQPVLYVLPPGNPKYNAQMTDPSLPNFEILEPNVGWPDFLVYNPDAPDGDKWHNLWFYDKARSVEWLDWLVATGKYRAFYPKGAKGEDPAPIRILERVENPQ